MFYTNPGKALTIVYCIFTNNFVICCVYFITSTKLQILQWNNNKKYTGAITDKCPFLLFTQCIDKNNTRCIEYKLQRCRVLQCPTVLF